MYGGRSLPNHPSPHLSHSLRLKLEPIPLHLWYYLGLLGMQPRLILYQLQCRLTARLYFSDHPPAKLEAALAQIPFHLSELRLPSSHTRGLSCVVALINTAAAQSRSKGIKQGWQNVEKILHCRSVGSIQLHDRTIDKVERKFVHSFKRYKGKMEMLVATSSCTYDRLVKILQKYPSVEHTTMDEHRSKLPRHTSTQANFR